MTKVKQKITKLEKIEIRIDGGEKELIRKAAEREGLTISAWARKVLLRVAGE